MLLRMDEDKIHEICRGIMKLEHHPQVKVFGVHGHHNRFATCMVYVPRDLYSRELRQRILQILQTELKADHIDFDATFSSENALASLRFFASIPQPQKRAADFARIESLIVDVAQNWDENLREALFAELGEGEDSTVALNLLRGVPGGYKDAHSVQNAVRDLTLLCPVSYTHLTLPTNREV